MVLIRMCVCVRACVLIMPYTFQYHPEDEKRGPRVANSILLLTDKNSRQVSGVLRYLRRTDALLPPELLRFAEGIQQVKEQQKAHRPLCGYLKSLGFCKWVAL